MAMSNRSILAQSLRIPAKDPKLFLLLLLTLAVLPQLLLLLADHDFLTPIVSKLVSDCTAFSSMQAASPDGSTALMLLPLLEDLRGLFLYLFVTRAIAFVFSIFKWIMVVHAVDMAGQVTPRDLLRKVGSSWAGTFVTILLCNILLSVYLGTLLWVFVFSALALYDHPVLLVLTFLVLLLLLASSLVYISLVLDLALVISVVEGGCYGFGAIDKATKVLRGRRVQGFLLSLLMNTISFLLFFLYGLLVQMAASLTAGVVNLCLMSVLPIIYMVVYTVFYGDCRSSDGGEFQLLGVQLENKLVVDQI